MSRDICDPPTTHRYVSDPNDRRLIRCRRCGFTRPDDDRSYSEAMADLVERSGTGSEPAMWRAVGEAPIVDMGPCSCGEERCEPVNLPGGYHGDFRCLTCGVVRATPAEEGR